MKSKVLVFLLFAVIPQLIAGLFHRCPPKEILEPSCSCSKIGSQVMITCKEINRTADLQITLKKFSNYVIDKLIIQKTKVYELVSGVFSKLSIHKITFDQLIVQILPMFSFLNGVDDTVEELQFLNCKVEEWLWDKGNHFFFIQSIYFDNTPLPKVMTQPIFSFFPNNIRHLKLKKSGIERLGDSALRKFAHLETLELDDNALTTYHRGDFPIPAKRLKYLSLKGNPLKSLPNDAFVQMRRLEFLSLVATQLTSLHEETFKPVWEQLDEIYFNSIVLNCNCNSTWLLEKVQASIYRPPMCKLNGKNKTMNEIKYLEICKNI